MVTTDSGGSADVAYNMAFQSNDKVLLAGSSDNDFALARYDTTGALDTSFSGDGLLTTSFGTPSYAEGVVLQADGKIVAAGTDNPDFAIARYEGDVLTTPTGTPTATSTSTPTRTPTRTSTIAPTMTHTPTTTRTIYTHEHGHNTFNNSGPYHLARYSSA